MQFGCSVSDSSYYSFSSRSKTAQNKTTIPGSRNLFSHYHSQTSQTCSPTFSLAVTQKVVQETVFLPLAFPHHCPKISLHSIMIYFLLGTGYILTDGIQCPVAVSVPAASGGNAVSPGRWCHWVQTSCLPFLHVWCYTDILWPLTLRRL